MDIVGTTTSPPPTPPALARDIRMARIKMPTNSMKRKYENGLDLCWQTLIPFTSAIQVSNFEQLLSF